MLAMVMRFKIETYAKENSTFYKIMGNTLPKELQCPVNPFKTQKGKV